MTESETQLNIDSHGVRRKCVNSFGNSFTETDIICLSVKGTLCGVDVMWRLLWEHLSNEWTVIGAC